MEHTIDHLMHINAPISNVFKAISKGENLKQWYTTDVVENEDKTKTFKWGEMFLLIKCTEIENEKISWEFLESSMPIESLYMTYELSGMNQNQRLLHFQFDKTVLSFLSI